MQKKKVLTRQTTQEANNKSSQRQSKSNTKSTNKPTSQTIKFKFTKSKIHHPKRQHTQKTKQRASNQQTNVI